MGGGDINPNYRAGGRTRGSLTTGSEAAEPNKGRTYVISGPVDPEADPAGTKSPKLALVEDNISPLEQQLIAAEHQQGEPSTSSKRSGSGGSAGKQRVTRGSISISSPGGPGVAAAGDMAPT